jgi:hypothetical protein
MNPAKLDILFAFTNYAGNGGIASTIPHLRSWWAKQYDWLSKDERIGRIADLPQKVVSDTPITMVRNKCLRVAQEQNFDLLVFIDSDNCPDLYEKEDPSAKSFLESSLDFVYKRLVNGIPTVIAAPYCGPPPHPVYGGEENVYVFKWKSIASDENYFAGAKIEAYDRDEAALLKGIQPAAALPTGVCMVAIKALECMSPPYFRYEWEDEWEDKKITTEDVYFTRNVGMAGALKYGTPIVFCNWDCWAGHYKQKMVGKPRVMRIEEVNEVFVKAVKDNLNIGDEIQYMGFRPDNTVPIPPGLQAVLDMQATKQKMKDKGWVLQPTLFQLDEHQYWVLGWTTAAKEVQVLLDAIGSVRARNDQMLGVEVGSWTGYTASKMLDKFPNLLLSCVDTFRGSSDGEHDATAELIRAAVVETGDPDILHTLFQRNTKRFGDRCRELWMPSLEAAEHFADKSLDFVFIDADHSYEACRADIEAWLPKIKPNGIIIGHDYTDQFPGVPKAVNESFGTAVQDANTMWWVKLEDIQPDHVIIADRMGDKYTERDDTLIAPEDRESFKRLLNETMGRISKDSRKLVYIGEPDPATLDAMSAKASVFCVCERSPALKHARGLCEEVKFLQVNSLDESVYSDAWWDDGDADLVFVQQDAASVDLLQRAFDLLKQDGLLCGNGPIVELAFEGTSVGRYRESGIWGIPRDVYKEDLSSNGKAVAH